MLSCNNNNNISLVIPYACMPTNSNSHLVQMISIVSIFIDTFFIWYVYVLKRKAIDVKFILQYQQEERQSECLNV